MRDFFAVLMQVSFEAKSCEDDLQACLECWKPLLQAVSQRRGHSVSSLISDTLVHRLQTMDDLEFSEDEVSAMGLPSKNDEMGSSLIESKLDDHTLAHCFSFLSVKDVCTGIERSSHRFLQVSRNSHFHFFEQSSEWHSSNTCLEELIEYGELETPLDRLLHSHPNIPDSIALRNLHRFKIGRLKYDPVHSIDNSHSHRKLRFQDVIRVIGSNVHSLELWVHYLLNENEHYFFPPILSHITDVIFNVADSDPLEIMCSAFPKCRILRISGQCRSLKPLNQLSELESLTIRSSGSSEESMRDLDPACLPNLKSLVIHTKDISHFSPLLLSQLESLDLQMSSIPEGTTLGGNLSSLRRLNVRGLREPSLSKMLVSQLGLPEKIPSVRLDFTEWDVLVDWVGRVQELECIVHRAYFVSYTVNDALKTEMLANWKLDQFLVILDRPQESDIEMICSLMKHPNTQSTQMKISLIQGHAKKHSFKSMVDRVGSVAAIRPNCTVEFK